MDAPGSVCEGRGFQEGADVIVGLLIAGAEVEGGEDLEAVVLMAEVEGLSDIVVVRECRF